MQTAKHMNSLVILFLLGFSLMVPSSVAFGESLEDAKWVTKLDDNWTITLRIGRSRRVQYETYREADFLVTISPDRDYSGNVMGGHQEKGICKLQYKGTLLQCDQLYGINIYLTLDEEFPDIARGNMQFEIRGSYEPQWETEPNAMWERQ